MRGGADMKLFNRVFLHLSLWSMGVLAIWAMCFYYAMMDEINDEVDDSLEDYSEQIIIRSLAGEELPSHNSGSNNQYYLQKVTQEYAGTHPHISYKDTMVYIGTKKETEPARILTTIFDDGKGQFYQLEVSTPTVEKADLRESILLLLIGLYVALLFAILMVYVGVFRKSMKPFYRLLHWLDNHRLGSKYVPLSNPTTVTEFQRLNEAVTSYAEHSKNLFEQQKEFIGNASHEMQTPLAVCRNRIEMLMEDESLSETQLEELAKTHQTLVHVTKLNKSLLLLSKIDNHQFTDVKTMNLNGVLKGYVDDYREVYAHRGIQLEWKETGNFEVTMNDALAVALVTNLLKNAYIHNVDSGRIRIEVTPDYMIFGNTGSEEPLDGNKVFDRFYQGQKKEGSTGLGLAIVHSICMQYGLQIAYSHQQGLHQFTLSRKHS